MKKIKIGLAGLGTVGKGVYEILKKDVDIIKLRSNVEFEIVAVSARSNKEFVDKNIKFYSNPIDLAKDSEVEIVVEVIGGLGIAKDLVELAIKNGKKVVTANKAFLAECGDEIVELLKNNKGYIAFEASTAGANPVIKTFKESFTSSEITEFYAILNGTCNFILSKMTSEGSDFADTLKEAQKLGYAEADPTLDIKGFDTAHKLAILSAISSNSKPAFKKLYIEGVDEIDAQDIELADELGYKIKLLAIYKKFKNLSQQSVYPALIKKTEKIAQIDGPFNAVLANTTNASWNMSIGRGAGGFTTGSAVVADLIDIARNRCTSLFGVEEEKLNNSEILDISQRVGKYFLKVIVNKNLAQKNNLAEVVLGNKIKVNQAAFIDKDDKIICGFLTEENKEQEIVNLLQSLDSNLVETKKLIRVEETNF